MKRAVSRGLVAASGGSSRRRAAAAAPTIRLQSSSSTTPSSAITPQPASSHAPATIPIDFAVASRVSGQESQTLEVQLSPGQVLRAERELHFQSLTLLAGNARGDGKVDGDGGRHVT